MLVKDVMTKDVGGLIPEATLKEAAHKMESLGVGFLPVCNGERIVGVITDRDITVRAVAKGKNPAEALVKDYMTPRVHWCFGNENIELAAAAMEKNKIRRLVVLDQNKLLVGVISLGDIAVHAQNSKAACKVLEEVSRPAQPRRGIKRVKK